MLGRRSNQLAVAMVCVAVEVARRKAERVMICFMGVKKSGLDPDRCFLFWVAEGLGGFSVTL